MLRRRHRDDEPGDLGADPIRFADAYGRSILVSRAEYRERILPGAIRDAWDDPDALASVVADALRDGFASEVIAATEHLQAIDSMGERAAALRAIALLDAGRIDDADATLAAFVSADGPSGVIVTNRAKVAAARGDEAAVDRLLDEAVALDPNQENGLSWWHLRLVEHHGRGTAAARLRSLAGAPNAWRPQLVLARLAVEDGRVIDAVDLCRTVVERAPLHSDALLGVTGLLGNADRVDDMLEIVLPVYDAAVGDPLVGFNLVEACIRARRADAGERLLHALALRNLPPFRDAITGYSGRLAELVAGERPSGPVGDDEVRDLQLMAFDDPLWFASLGEPAWLLPVPVAAAPAVMFVGWSVQLPDAPDQAAVGRIDLPGTLSRGVPALLADVVRERVGGATTLVVPVVPGGGPAVLGAPWSASAVANVAEGRTPPPDIVVTGALDARSAARAVRLDLWHPGDDAPAHVVNGSLRDGDGAGAAVEHLLAETTAALAAMGALPTRVVTITLPPAPSLPPYVVGLERLMVLRFAADGVVPPTSLWGERDMLEWMLGVALDAGASHAPKVVFVAGLAANRRYGSAVYREFEERALKLVEDEGGSETPLGALAPFVHRIYGHDAAFGAARDQRLMTAGPMERAWLDRI